MLSFSTKPWLNISLKKEGKKNGQSCFKNNKGRIQPRQPGFKQSFVFAFVFYFVLVSEFNRGRLRSRAPQFVWVTETTKNTNIKTNWQFDWKKRKYKWTKFVFAFVFYFFFVSEMNRGGLTQLVRNSFELQKLQKN